MKLAKLILLIALGSKFGSESSGNHCERENLTEVTSVDKTNTNPLFGRSKTALNQRHSLGILIKKMWQKGNIQNKILAPGEINQLQLTGQATVYQGRRRRDTHYTKEQTHATIQS